MPLDSFPHGDLAVVIGASGGIGGALLRSVDDSGAFATTVGFSRHGAHGLDLRDEASIARCAAHAAGLGTLRLVLVATGILHGPGLKPEKTFRQLDPAAMTAGFAVNAIGPALLMKHFLPLLPAHGKAVFATLSARVGSVGDNHLGGWYTYRAAKAALNQLVRTAAVELRRRAPGAICVALHPGTVRTDLSAPFAKVGLDVQSPDVAAKRLLAVIDQLGPDDSGGFFDQHGAAVPW
ncbi:MAG: SDR family NAD(P)-dependent oxidoreductase [Casimicrobiaceae bacterium]